MIRSTSFFVGLLSLAVLVSGQSSSAPSTTDPTAQTPATVHASSQESSQQSTAPPTPLFHIDTRLVVLDVVAIDHDGEPVRGLDRDAFQVLEDGKPQQLRMFEEHVPAVQPAVLPEIRLPDHEYTNFPKQANSSAVNIVLFDILNTPLNDQLYARAQMVEFLKTLPRGQRTALFTLGNDLRMIAGFTTGTDELVAAANTVKPNASSYLDTIEERQASDQQISTLTAGPSPSQGAGAPGFGQMMQDFAHQTARVRLANREQRTFEALGQLARAVSGYPGRKNLLWLSEAFPTLISAPVGSSPDFARSYLELLQKSSGLLASSQISVYPIDVRGLSVRGGREVTGSQATMQDIAQQTGGEAFYNSNDLKGALKRSIEHGSTYYTLAYVPENKKWDGRFRHVTVKVNRGDLSLHYRRGYAAVKDDPSVTEAAHQTLVAEMQPGVPESTMLLLRAQIVPDDKTGKVQIDCAVFAPDISFSGDRLHHAKLEWVVVAWDKDNKPAANTSETMELDLQPSTYESMQKNGISAKQEVTLKPGAYHLRVGVMDYTTSKIGTLEVPVRINAMTASR